MVAICCLWNETKSNFCVFQNCVCILLFQLFVCCVLNFSFFALDSAYSLNRLGKYEQSKSTISRTHLTLHTVITRCFLAISLACTTDIKTRKERSQRNQSYLHVSWHPMNFTKRQRKTVLWKKYCERKKIEMIKSKAYHPQSKGKVERSHRTLRKSPTKKILQIKSLFSYLRRT